MPFIPSSEAKNAYFMSGELNSLHKEFTGKVVCHIT